jgi:hypothetical protein
VLKIISSKSFSKKSIIKKYPTSAKAIRSHRAVN